MSDDNHSESYNNFFENFTHSFAVSRLLLRKAHGEGSLIEGIILYASIIDATLRNIIAIKTGRSDGKGRVILESDLFYHNEDNWYTERNVYNKALEVKIISKDECRQLHKMYDFRNEVVHRFILSGITYDDIAKKLIEYESIYQNLYSKLEGIDPPQELSNAEMEEIEKKLLKKIINPPKN